MYRKFALTIFIAVLLLMLQTTAYADTDGSEMLLTDKPDQLVLQLGPQWSGVQFELKTDAGVFPAPLTVDSSGVLKMDLGGSTAYILSCIASPVPIPDLESPGETTEPQPSEDTLSEVIAADNTEPEAASQEEPSPEESTDEFTREREQESNKDEPAESSEGIPTGQLIFLLAGLAAAVGGLIFLQYVKSRRKDYYYDDGEDDE